MRAVMTREELAGHQVDAHGRDYSRSDDGYGDMEVNGEEGWHAVAGWGLDGWDLGDWPYAVLSIRRHAGAPEQDLAPCWELLSVCEGDHTIYRFQNEEDRTAAIDYLFMWYRLGHDDLPELGLTWEDRTRLDAGELEIPERYRGPFSWARLDASKAEV